MTKVLKMLHRSVGLAPLWSFMIIRLVYLLQSLSQHIYTRVVNRGTGTKLCQRTVIVFPSLIRGDSSRRLQHQNIGMLRKFGGMFCLHLFHNKERIMEKSGNAIQCKHSLTFSAAPNNTELFAGNRDLNRPANFGICTVWFSQYPSWTRSIQLNFEALR